MYHQKWKTKHWKISASVDKDVDKQNIQEAAEWIKAGQVVAFPTETVYGLGADATSSAAIRNIFEAKGRPLDNPLIVHIADEAELRGVVDVTKPLPALAQILMDQFWPGPLTLILPKGEEVCPRVTAGLSTVAVRMPAHPLALAFIKACGRPLAAPSANRSGKPSPTRAAHVLHDLEGSIAGVLNGGETGVGVESTVVDLTIEPPLILRPGGITQEELQEVVPEIRMDPALLSSTQSIAISQSPEASLRSSEEWPQSPGGMPKSPGVKYQHYAPQGKMWVVAAEKGLEHMRTTIEQRMRADLQAGYRVGVITTTDGLQRYEQRLPQALVVSVGNREDLSTVAQGLYRVLRELDTHQIERIYTESFPHEGMGTAIMNRLMKAAAGHVID